MPTLQQLIIYQKYPNPFDNITYGNFWQENFPYQTVKSIHEKAFLEIIQEIDILKRDAISKTRSILLIGDPGCGKSHVLGRLKSQLNSKAFFIYVQPIPDSDYFWRHTLRYTVDSLLHIPEGEKDSQIRLWLKGLPVFQKQGLLKKILGEKTAFIHELKNSYPTDIYESKKFFGILYQLAKNEQYSLACDWLKGDQLDEEDLKILGVSNSIDSELAAQGILKNFGRIANATKPIILCFDQIERAIKDTLGLNTSFHNECFTNFFIIISIIREEWQSYKQTMIQSDISRINKQITLDSINLKQAEEIWESRLAPLHNLANPKPESSIAPLDRNELEKHSPGGKINLRASLNLGGILYAAIKSATPKETPVNPVESIEPDPFIILWENKFKTTQNKVDKINQFSDKELIDMLCEALKALKIEDINPNFLPGVSAVLSFSYQDPKTAKKIGIVWQNNPHGTSFNALMNACEKVKKQNKCHSLILIRNQKPGKSGTVGNDLYSQLFKPNSKEYTHRQIILEDIYYLNTYYELAKDAYSSQLGINFADVTIQKLQELVRSHQVLNNCQLLQKLNLVTPIPTLDYKSPEIAYPSQEEVLKIVKEALTIGLNDILEKVKHNPQFNHVKAEDIKKIILELGKQKPPIILLLNPTEKDKELVISYIPSKFIKSK